MCIRHTLCAVVECSQLELHEVKIASINQRVSASTLLVGSYEGKLTSSGISSNGNLTELFIPGGRKTLGECSTQRIVLRCRASPLRITLRLRFLHRHALICSGRRPS